MKTIHVPYLLCLCFLTACAHNNWHGGSKQLFSKELSSTKSDDGEMHSKFKYYGHFNTVGAVALIAGHNTDESARLACFSQFPDDMWLNYSAVAVAVWGSVPPFCCYRARIMSSLHSLHGGDAKAVANRRAILKELIHNSDTRDRDEHWKIGFLIHALGDSYAHVHTSTCGEKAYGSIFGHGFDCSVKPDYISQHLDTYDAYVKNLYEALDGDYSEDQSRHLAEFLSKVREAAKSKPSVKCAEAAVEDYITKAYTYPVDEDGSELLEKWKLEVKFCKVNPFLKELHKRLKKQTPLAEK